MQIWERKLLRGSAKRARRWWAVGSGSRVVLFVESWGRQGPPSAQIEGRQSPKS